MEENLKCYDFKKYILKKGEFDEEIDATYIIHLKNNNRLDHILEQLTLYQPTKTIYIVFNEGFKKCSKSKFIKSTVDDLIDANYQILKHANRMNYNNILVLEDDFIFNAEIKQDNHKKQIIKFLKNNKNNPFMYLLGCAPILLVPYNDYHYKPLLSGGMHAVIYNKQMRDIVISIDQKKILDWDELGSWFRYKYTYYMPLCYQLFPETENSKSWGKNNSYLIEYCKQLGPTFLKMLQLDKKTEPGYKILYIISKCLFFIIIILLIIICLLVIFFIILSLKKNFGSNIKNLYSKFIKKKFLSR